MSFQEDRDLALDGLGPALELTDTCRQKLDIADPFHLVDRHQGESQFFLGVDSDEILIDNRLGNRGNSPASGGHATLDLVDRAILCGTTLGRRHKLGITRPDRRQHDPISPGDLSVVAPLAAAMSIGAVAVRNEPKRYGTVEKILHLPDLDTELARDRLVTRLDDGEGASLPIVGLCPRKQGV